jgi:hypothetical protein
MFSNVPNERFALLLNCGVNTVWPAAEIELRPLDFSSKYGLISLSVR